jgi:hypothetical protein
MLNALGNYLTSKGLFSGLLDEYSGADAGYSLQRLSKSTTNVIRARRSIDNSESDFSASDIGDPLRQFAMNDSSELLGYAKSGNRMYFDGVNDYINTGIGLPSAGKIEFQYVHLNSRQYASIVGRRNIAGTDEVYLTFFDAAGSILSLQINGVNVTSGSSFTYGQTYKIAFTWGSGTAELFVDDVSQGSASYVGGFTANSILIGNSATPNYTEGIIYDVDIYDTDQTTIITAYDGYGNTNADWEDQVGSNDGTVSGSPALFSGQGFDAFVTTWYDQSGNSRDATQTTASAQPTIVDNGSIITNDNGHASVLFDGGGDYFQLPFAAGSNSGYFITSLVEPNDNTTNQFLIDFRDGAGDGITLLGLSSGVINARTNAVSASQNYDSDPQLFTGEYTGTDLTAYVDSVGGTSLSGSNTNATTNGRIGSVAYGGGTLTWSGTISEMIIYLSDESANRSAIESNIIERYGP